MIVALIGKDDIFKVNLPNIINGSYWISDEKGRKLINIEGLNGKWKIHSNDNIKIIKLLSNIEQVKITKAWIDSNTINSYELREYMSVRIYIEKTKQLYVLYCAPMLEDYIHLDMKKISELMIGKSDKNDIIYKDLLIKDIHAKIFHNNNVLLIENYDTEFAIFVNNKPVIGRRKLLFNGDVIFIMGLKIIIMGRELFINNPLNKVTFSKDKFTINERKTQLINTKEDDNVDVEIYSETDYFARAPRITNIIEREKVKIDPPPQADKKQGMPLIYVLGSSLSMGLISVISMISTINSLIDGTATIKSTIFSLAMSGAMLLSMILLPVLNTRYEKKEKKKYEETRQSRYRKYINSKIKQIDEIMDKQKKILFQNYLSVGECADIIYTKSPRLWERKIDDDDFLTIRLGKGNLPLEVDIEYPEERFTMEDDDLLDILNTLGNKSKILTDVPIVTSLAKKNITALVVENDERLVEKFIQNLLIQLIAFHSYEDVKLVFLLDNEKKSNWEHIKMLPHLWDNAKQIRFFADNYNDMEEISKYLEKDLEYRLSIDGEVDYKSFIPYYLIITDDYKKIEKLKIIEDIRKLKGNIGFSIFCISNNFIDLPNECQTFITIQDRVGKVFDSARSSENQNEFIFDDTNTFFFEKISKEISNVPIKYTASEQMSLPDTYTFLEMYDVGRIEGLNILNRWRTNDSCVSLQAPVGINSSGNIISLDIHEKAHGPHGLIAGSTGSGKSEFIITYILSMAINYHPDDVVFVLIDYKGGGLAGAFEKNNIKLPHLVGTITNIDTVGLKRSLVSIQSELKRRQIMFNEARNKTDEGTIDIYKYQKLYHNGIVDKPIPHLLIICDEFAELKQQQEDFMDELISVARIGRSLGVHLILATQKPAGIVNDQIRSNSKFGICLKVQEKEDSQDVIKRPDAAELKKVGQFYMQVGNNEYFTLGQSAWAGAPYYPSDMTQKKISDTIEIISNIGRILKEKGNQKQEKVNKEGEQLTNIVKSIYELAKKENITAENLWIEDIPDTIFVSNIRKKYNIKKQKNVISAVIGEFDDPFNQRQGALMLNLTNDGNTIVFGNAESGKETLLSTAIYDLITNYEADEVKIYLMDFGSEALKIFKNSPQVGDIVFINEHEKIQRLFEMLQKEIARRISILSEYGGDYNLYINTEKDSMPMIVVMMNSYEAFAEIYENEYDDVFLSLTRDGIRCGIVFVVTASNPSDIRYRLSQNFKQKIALQLNNEDDFLNIFDGIRDKRPAKIFGRGIVKLEDIYEFQTAKICESKDWNSYIKQTIEKLEQKSKVKAVPIPVLPEKVELSDIKGSLEDISKVPIGINKKTLDIFTYNFRRNLVNVIISKNMESSLEFVQSLIEELKELDDVKLDIFDLEKVLQINKSNWKVDYENFVLEMENKLNKDKHKICIIVGIDKFISEQEAGEERLANILAKAKELTNYSFIIVENAARLKEHEYDEWYKRYVPGDTGIWVGRGAEDQYVLNIMSSRREIENNCAKSYGHVVEEGELTIVKLLGVRDKE